MTGTERDPIRDYIAANRGTYTREAITEHMLAAGHDRAAIDAAWEREAEPAGAARTGWRLSGRAIVVLAVVGAIGAFIVWRDDQYGTGGIATAIYFVLAMVLLGIGKWVSVLVDRGHIGWAAALLALTGGGATAASIGSPIIAIPAAVATLALLLALLVTRGGGPAGVGMVGAAVPIVFWVVLTGICYAPALGA